MGSKIHSKTVNLKDLKRANKFLDDSFINERTEITDKDKVYTKDTKGNTILRDLPEDLEQATVDETIEYIKGNIYSINTSVMYGSFSGAVKIRKNGQASITIIPNTNYLLPKSVADIEVKNATIVSYDSSTGILVIKNPTKNVIINTECPITLYNVNCEVYNGTYTGDTAVEIFGTTQITLYADTHFKLPDVVEVTGANYSYDKDRGVITITNISQDVYVKVYCFIENGFSVTPLEDNCAMLIFIYVDGLAYTDFQYSFDGAHWEVYPREWYAVQLLKGQKVFVRNTKNRLCVDTSHYVRVNIQSNEPSRKFRPFKAEGDLAALINYGPLYEGCFANMFWCTEVVSMPKLPPPPEDTGIYPKNTFMNMFAGCKSLKYLSEIPAVTDLNKYEFYSMFYGCNLIKLREESGYGNYLFTCPEYIEWEPKSSAIEDMFNGCNAGEFKGDYPRPNKSYYWYLSDVVEMATSNGVFDKLITEAIVGVSYSVKVTPDFGCVLPDDITITNATYTWDKSTGTLTFTHNVEGDVEIVVNCIADSLFAVDDMETIATQCIAGNHINRYRVGEEKIIQINGIEHIFTILGFNHDAPNTITVGLIPYDGYWSYQQDKVLIDSTRWKKRLYHTTEDKWYNIWWASTPKIAQTNGYQDWEKSDLVKPLIDELYTNDALSYKGASIKKYMKEVSKASFYKKSTADNDWGVKYLDTHTFLLSSCEHIDKTKYKPSIAELTEGSRYDYFGKMIITEGAEPRTYINNGTAIPGVGKFTRVTGIWYRTPGTSSRSTEGACVCTKNSNFDFYYVNDACGSNWGTYGIAFCMTLGAPESPIRVTGSYGTYTSDKLLSRGGTATVSINPIENYTFPLSVTVTGCSYIYDNTTGIITLSDPDETQEAVAVVFKCRPNPDYGFFEKDTFEEISNQCTAGTHTDRYYIGEEKTITTSDGVNYKFTILGFDHDAPNTITIGLSPFDGYGLWDKDGNIIKAAAIGSTRYKNRLYMHTQDKPWLITWASSNSAKQYFSRPRYTAEDTGTMSNIVNIKYNLEGAIYDEMKVLIGEEYLQDTIKLCTYCNGTTPGRSDNWQVESYSCRIFPYSEMEICGKQKDGVRGIEGKQYAYFKAVGITSTQTNYAKLNAGNVITPTEGASSSCYGVWSRSFPYDKSDRAFIASRAGYPVATELANTNAAVAFGLVLGEKNYMITTTVTNGSSTNVKWMKKNDTTTITITPNTDYKLPPSISVSGATYTYDATTGIITLTNPTGNITIKVICHLIDYFATDSLEEISNQCAAGTHTSRYAIGEERVIALNGVNHTFTILGFDHDAPNTITIGLVPLDYYWSAATNTRSKNTRRWNSRFYMRSQGKPWVVQGASLASIRYYNNRYRYTTNNTKSANLYVDYKYVIERYALPSVRTSLGNYLQTVIKPCAYNNNGSSSGGGSISDYKNDNYSCQIFPLAAYEISSTTYEPKEGAQYEYFNKALGTFNNSSKYLAMNSGTGTSHANPMPAEGNYEFCYGYWLRSPNVAGGVCTIQQSNIRVEEGFIGDYSLLEQLGITFGIVLGEKTYNISTTVNNGTSTGSTSIKASGTASVTITPDTGYTLPSTITVTNATYTYDSSTGVISLSNATGNIVITVDCQA